MCTAEAVEWFLANVEAQEWQWLGRTLCVDYHAALEIVVRLVNTDFRLDW